VSPSSGSSERASPRSAGRESATGEALLERTRKELDRIAARKRTAKAETLGAQVGRVMAKTKMGKHLTWSVKAGRLEL
jgi:hypothetical protein